MYSCKIWHNTNQRVVVAEAVVVSLDFQPDQLFLDISAFDPLRFVVVRRAIPEFATPHEEPLSSSNSESSQ
eukprot:6221355-Amphidinium_carterae.1